MTVLPELRRLLAEATPGPWTLEDRAEGSTDVYRTRRHYVTMRDSENASVFGYEWVYPAAFDREAGIDSQQYRAAAALIVALRNHADALLAVVEAARKFVSAEDEWHLRHGMGRERTPYWRAMVAARRDLRAALARLDPKDTP